MSLVKSTIRTQVHQLVGNDDQIIASDLNTMLEAANDEILEAYSWSRRKKDVLINLIAPISSTSTTLLTISNGSSVGTFGADPSIGAAESPYIRIDGDDSYHWAVVAVGTSLGLEKEWGKDDITDGSWEAFYHIYTISSDCDKIVSFSGNRKITEIARQELDRLDPKRNTKADHPQVFSYVQRDSSDDVQVEFWPVPNSAQVIRCHYLKRGTIASDSDKPLYPSNVLKWKAAVSACYFLKAKTGDRTWFDLAQGYQAEYTRAYSEAKEEDLALFGASQAQKYSDDDFQMGDDYYRNHLY